MCNDNSYLIEKEKQSTAVPHVTLDLTPDEADAMLSIMLHVANLNKLNSSPEMINHLLVAPDVPPFDCQIILATGYNDPKGRIFPSQLSHLRTP